MFVKKITLSQQIFFSTIILVSFSLAIVAWININQIKKDTTNYNIERLARKDRAVAKSIEAIINLSTQYNVDLETAFRPILKDVGFIHKLKKNSPDKNFIPINKSATCKYMKMITFDKVLETLKSESPEVKVEKYIAAIAKMAIDRMVGLV